jgi:hypothetical protein
MYILQKISLGPLDIIFYNFITNVCVKTINQDGGSMMSAGKHRNSVDNFIVDQLQAQHSR